MTRSQYRLLNKLLNKKRKDGHILKKIHHMVEETGGIDYAKNKLDDFSNRAIDSISSYPNSVIKQSLIDLVGFNVNRVK